MYIVYLPRELGISVDSHHQHSARPIWGRARDLRVPMACSLVDATFYWNATAWNNLAGLCGLRCNVEMLAGPTCATECFAANGLSTSCSICAGDQGYCSAANCLMECIADRTAAACLECADAKCGAAFTSCSGLSTEGPLPEVGAVAILAPSTPPIPAPSARLGEIKADGTCFDGDLGFGGSLLRRQPTLATSSAPGGIGLLQDPEACWRIASWKDTAKTDSLLKAALAPQLTTVVSTSGAGHCLWLALRTRHSQKRGSELLGSLAVTTVARRRRQAALGGCQLC